ncbi:MAG: hypothetical protein HS130_09895 [Deltaproteobacteria bacterium]|nr:hypothetical protein [Deltaproteobacteria bacterium]
MADNNNLLLEIVTPRAPLNGGRGSDRPRTGRRVRGALRGIPVPPLLKPGEVAFRKGAESGVLAVGRGYAEVLPGKTTILVDTAVRESEIDLEAVRKEAQELPRPSVPLARRTRPMRRPRTGSITRKPGSG